MAMLSVAGISFAQTTERPVIEITGTGSLESLLRDNLEIVQHVADVNMTKEERQRLIGITPQKIRDLLATEGYFSPTVTYETAQEADRPIVRFNVALGAITQVDTVGIHFVGAIAEGPHADPERMENLRRRWGLNPGEPFRQKAWSDAKDTLLKGLLDSDYPAAKIVQSEAQIDPEQHKAMLMVEVDSGPFFTFGALQITGLERYKREMIDVLNPINPGDPYSQARLTELQTRLQDSGYFRSVFATINADPDHPDQVPVQLNLTENERRRLSFGAGFSTDTGARGQVKWLDRQFLGRNWRMESELRVDRQTGLLGSDLYFPALDNGWRPSLGAHYERTDIANEIDDKIRVDARLTGPIKTDEEAWGSSYLADRQRLGGDSINNRQALIASYFYTRRRVDNLLSPQRGYAASIELDGGITGALNQKNLARVVGHGYSLLPLGSRWTAVLRGQFGQVFGAKRDAVPGDLLFRTGGDQSVRGYAYNSLGVPVVQNGSESIVGGPVMAAMSAELIYKITPTWGAAIFKDAGDAADSWREFKLKQGTGIGARWRSPIGMVNLDLAYG
ncbi:MAG: autotransporter assembly complex protein TamA, partial [Burkholderiaceae bacterium]